MKSLNIIAVLFILLSLRYVDNNNTIHISFIFICLGGFIFGLSLVAKRYFKL